MTEREMVAFDLLREWMEKQFDQQSEQIARHGNLLTAIDERITVTERSVTEMRARLDTSDGKVARMDDVFTRMEQVADAFESILRIARKGRAFWVATGSFVASVLLLLDVIARSLPRLPW